MPKLLIPLIAIALAACGNGDARAGEKPAADFAAQGPEGCPKGAGDTARAICLATLPRAPEERARTLIRVVQRGETICVHTGPAQGLDDEERVSVVNGRVVDRVRSDSTGCQ